MDSYPAQYICLALQPANKKTVPIPKFLKVMADGKDHYSAQCVLSLYLFPTSQRHQQLTRQKWPERKIPKTESVLSD